MKKREVRFLQAAEIRASEDGKKIGGYVAVFNSPSEDLGGFREIIKPGAFKRTLAEGADVRGLINHDANLVLGRTKSGTLSLKEDSRGLAFECDMPDTSYARDLAESMRRGDIDQCSFAFYVVEQNWNYAKDAIGDMEITRELVDVDLLDASVVTYPAYPSSSANLRALFPEGQPESVEAGIVPPPQNADDGALELKARRTRLQELVS